MTKWFLFSALWWVTGNPLVALMVMLLAAWAADRAFLGLLPDPLHRVRAWLHRREMQRCIENNPADGPCLLALGRDAVERWQHRLARPLLVRALERMPQEPEARYLLALAEIGCGDVDAGGARVRELLREQPRYRFGEPWLEVGARLLARGRNDQALEALEGFARLQPSSVRGLYLLAIAHERRGDRARARAFRRQAWEEFKTLPRFRRKQDRRYAWRANPTRPILYGGVAAAVLATLVLLTWAWGGSARPLDHPDAPSAAVSNEDPGAGRLE